MGLNNKWLLLALVALTSSVAAKTTRLMDKEKYLTIKSWEAREISVEILDQEKIDQIYQKNRIESGSQRSNPDPIETVGSVIKVGRDLVALGEDIYRLVIKGKPSNVTKYAPISVVPKADGEAVDILETEGWKLPIKRTYEVRYVNAYDIDVVVFRYSVIFAYGGSYNGKGAYLTSVQIVPDSVSTLFGYDFTATMKLGGIQNNGTRDNPIAGATILMEYTVSTIVKAHNVVATFFVTGKGDFKKL